MKREILFKAKRIDNGEWVKGYYVFHPDGEHLIYWRPFIEASRNTYHHVNPETVCQFTGLLDKNGNKIFEWDICKGAANACIIVFGNGAFRWDSKYGQIINKDNFNFIEIIGNIHD